MIYGVGAVPMGVLMEDALLRPSIKHETKYSSVNIPTTSNIGHLCNTLNAKEGHYRRLENKTKEDLDMEHILRAAQEKIWMLWDALKESRKITICPNCGFEYYNEHVSTCIKCTKPIAHVTTIEEIPNSGIIVKAKIIDDKYFKQLKEESK